MTFGVRWLLHRMGICLNAYYNFRKDRKAGYREQKEQLKEKILKIYHEYSGNLGYRMMRVYLLQVKISLSHASILKYMQELGIRSMVTPKKLAYKKGDCHKKFENGMAMPKEDWKVIPNHHEALISKEIFEQVSAFRPEHSTTRNREKHPLTGKLYCGGWGYSLNYKPIRGKNKYRRFECRKHSLLQIPECCTYMNADLLEETVLFVLNKELMLRGNAMRQKENLFSFQKAGIHALKRKLDGYRQKKKQV